MGGCASPMECVQGLVHASEDFERELQGVFRSRWEVFWQLWNSDKMSQLGGRENALMNVIGNIVKYPSKPFGLQIDPATFFTLIPELSPGAVSAYDKEPTRLHAIITSVIEMNWEKDADSLHSVAGLRLV